jgi:hypothetical protein
MDKICAGFQESRDLKAAGFPQGTSFFRWYFTATDRAVLAPRHERFQWAAKMKTGEVDCLCDGYPVDWAMKEYEWLDAPTVQEIADWNPRAVLIVMPGVNQATANDRIELAATLADALARADAPRQ